MRDNVYTFKLAQVSDAHAWCQVMTKEGLSSGLDVVVSNTFATIKELKPYFDIAEEFNIVPNVILCQNNYGSIHNVPKTTIARMKNRFKFGISSLFI